MPGQISIDEWLQHSGDRLPRDENVEATKIQKIVRGFLTRRLPALPPQWESMSYYARRVYMRSNWSPQQIVAYH